MDVVDATVAMRYAQQYDDLPPSHQILMKVLAVATSQHYHDCPLQVARNSMDDLIDEGSDEEDFERIIAELVSVFMVENEREGDHPGVRVSCPALVDVV